MNATSNYSFLAKIFLPVLAVIVVWLLSGEEAEQRNSLESKLNKASDYAMTDFTLTVMNKNGNPARIISGTEMAHYPEDDSTEVLIPSVQFIEPGKDTWLIFANKATTQGKGDDILLTGNVIITQQDNPDIELRTEKLNLDTLHNTAYTDLAVSMKSDYGYSESIGLHASLEDKMINLHSRVKGRYDTPTIQ
ncbi:MAG: LPS export ABC transporter periplasmic protein LptC [Methylophaga sp.]|nr:LPS export ABC transporter periplasmic protein LptC [Methylophaga sp.]